MELTTKQIRYLRSQAHHLNPLVMMGKQGITEALYKEVDRGLLDHELIKVRIAAEDRHALKAMAEELTAATQAALVQVIGKIAVLYRPAPEPTIKLP